MSTNDATQEIRERITGSNTPPVTCLPPSRVGVPRYQEAPMCITGPASGDRHHDHETVDVIVRRLKRGRRAP